MTGPFLSVITGLMTSSFVSISSNEPSKSELGCYELVLSFEEREKVQQKLPKDRAIPRNFAKDFSLILMAFRGRGRGRGRGGFFDSRLARHEPYILFPENVSLPDLPNVEPLPNEEKVLIAGKIKLEYFWKSSCYHLEEGALKSKSQDADNPKKKTQVKREALSSYLKLTSSNFPAELIHGSKRVEPNHKKLRWDRGSDENKLEIFEKLEERSKGLNERDGQEGKGESDDEEGAEGEAEEESSDDDYNQNIDFDDDEDDLNMEEEADEDVYE
ncbi:hypothetical protein J5N97_017102 [Dioscorea zingiberensis]|uniref:DNA-directed RNA polymerase III subunit n=1 Tax=Dioscorea zingiberensis TaxID=325984 RepID=A0A9D5HG94_9LILI|nr:hypothetical protein J5N97_017102 [Dioscorea zingiberensis]